MLNNLLTFMKSGQLTEMLDQRVLWDSLLINLRKPHTYRVFAQLPNNMRVCLHKFDPCHTHEAFSHPHPWPGAFLILEGKYKMQVGYSSDRTRQPKPVLTEILSTHSAYEIVVPMTWHSVIPLETTYTVMLNDLPWDADYAHSEVRTTKGKDLGKMPEDELLLHLAKFKDLVESWRNING